MQNLKQLFSMNLQLEKIFTRSGLAFLLTLTIPGMSKSGEEKTGIGLTRDDIHKLSGLSYRTIDRVKKLLISAAVIFERNGQYRISRAMNELRNFLDNYAKYHAGVIIRNLSSIMNISQNSIVQKFVAGGEIILASNEELESTGECSIAYTSITAMSRDNIQFLSNQNFYHYSIGNRTLKKEDYIIDTLLVGSDGARNMAYAMLYLQHISNYLDRNYLIEMGTLFGIGEIMKAMLRYIDSYPAIGIEIPKNFPKVDEFRELCMLYGVALHDE